MISIDEFRYFQIKLAADGFPEYLFDMTGEDLIENILVPLLTKEPLYLRGQQVQAGKIKNIRIVVTGQPVQPELLVYNASTSGYNHYLRHEFANQTNLFEANRDVTNAIMQHLKRSSGWDNIQKILLENDRLRSELSQYQDDEAGRQKRIEGLVNNAAALAHILGAFLGGFNKF